MVGEMWWVMRLKGRGIKLLKEEIKFNG